MTTSQSVLLVGAGGLGAPVLEILARSSIARLTVVDDDRVEESNLHRQTLYTDEDVDRPKAEVVAAWLHEHAPQVEVRIVEDRFVPSTARSLLDGNQIVIEGADNLPTKFLVADAARLAGVAVVQAGAVRWNGWAWCSLDDSACLRCLFEDIPRDRVETCAEAGVVGPVVGLLGGLEGALAVRLLRGERPGGELWHYDGLQGVLRQTLVRRRKDCPLCSGTIRDLREDRYGAACAA